MPRSASESNPSFGTSSCLKNAFGSCEGKRAAGAWVGGLRFPPLGFPFAPFLPKELPLLS